MGAVKNARASLRGKPTGDDTPQKSKGRRVGAGLRNSWDHRVYSTVMSLEAVTFLPLSSIQVNSSLPLSVARIGKAM